MPKYVENTREFRLLSEKISTLTDEFGIKANRQDVVSFVKDEIKGVRPEGFVNDLIDNNFVIEENGVIIFSISKKGGDNMEKTCEHSGVTPGEQKVAEAILDHFKPAFKVGRIPSKIVFMSCLESALPTINKRVKADLAFKKMINNHYLEEQNNKIILGVKGEEYLSL